MAWNKKHLFRDYLAIHSYTYEILIVYYSFMTLRGLLLDKLIHLCEIFLRRHHMEITAHRQHYIPRAVKRGLLLNDPYELLYLPRDVL